jgi:hypothetical protein
VPLTAKPSSKPLRLLIVGSRRFSRPLTRALEQMSTIDVLDAAKTAAEASAIADSLEPDVLLAEAALADTVDTSVPGGRVVLAPWVVKWRDADETASVSRTDVVMAAVLLASPLQATAPTS